MVSTDPHEIPAACVIPPHVNVAHIDDLFIIHPGAAEAVLSAGCIEFAPNSKTDPAVDRDRTSAVLKDIHAARVIGGNLQVAIVVLILKHHTRPAFAGEAQHLLRSVCKVMLGWVVFFPGNVEFRHFGQPGYPLESAGAFHAYLGWGHVIGARRNTLLQHTVMVVHSNKRRRAARVAFGSDIRAVPAGAESTIIE